MDKIMISTYLKLFFGKDENEQAEHPEDTEYTPPKVREVYKQYT